MKHLIISLLLFVTVSYATIINVPADYATIQAGIDAAIDGDTVLVAAGTYIENISVSDKNIIIGSHFQINPDTSLINATVIKASTEGYIISLSNISSIVIDGLTIEGGFDEYQSYDGIIAGGPIDEEINSKLYIKNSIIKNCRVWGGESVALKLGLGFEYGPIDSLFLLNTKFIDNMQSYNTHGLINGEEGCIYTEIINCSFVNNLAATGSVLRVSGSIRIDSSTFINNQSTYIGGYGGIIWRPSSKIRIENSLVINNSGLVSFAYGNDDTLFIVNSTIINNDMVIGYVDSSPQLDKPIISLNNSIIWDNQNDIINSYFNEPWSYQYDSTFHVQYSLIDTNGLWYQFNVGSNNIFTNPLFCNADNGNYTLAENSPCVGTGENGANMGAFGIGCDAIILSISDELLPVTYTLHQNYPNPFNPVTTLRYDLPETGLVTITIYDMLGRQVKTLMDQTQDAGHKSLIWDATNDYGKPVSAGIYLYQIQAGEFVQTRKMVLLK